MEHKKELDELNKKSLEKIDELVKSRQNLDSEDHKKLMEAKDKWQTSWADFMKILMYLETLEI
jgi:mRNA-degrading endonuclease RelE of RelBE toxin-antitoxin system